MTDAGDNTAGVYLNDTAGGLLPSSIHYYAGVGPAGIAAGDLNWDSWPDVVIADAGSNAATPVLVLFGINPLPAGCCARPGTSRSPPDRTR